MIEIDDTCLAKDKDKNTEKAATHSTGFTYESHNIFIVQATTGLAPIEQHVFRILNYYRGRH